MLYSDDEYRLFSTELDGSSIVTIWSAMRPDNFDKKSMTYEEKKSYFFELLGRFLDEGKIRIGKHGKFLDGSIDEQISRYKIAFPKTEDEWKKKNEEIWFYEEDCPGGIVWIHENGYEDWT